MMFEAKIVLLFLPLLSLVHSAVSKPPPGSIPRGFSCPQPHGYFRHTDQCNEYIDCKFYVPLVLTCPVGLHFNPRSDWTEYPCDIPSKAQCDRPLTTTSTTTTTTTTPLPPTTPAPVSVVITPHDFSCPQPHGYFKHTEQCSDYIECKNYLPRTYSCPAGLHFNPRAQWTEYPCEEPSRVQCVREPIRSVRILATPEPVTITTTTTSTTTTTTTPPPQTKEVPTVIAPRDFSCPQQHGYFKHSNQCGEYVECKNYLPRTFSCPAGLHFNPDVEWTEYPCEQPAKVQCEEPPKTTSTTTTTTTTTTPPPPTTPVPVVITPRDFTCPQQHGYFKHTEQCDEYVECKNYVPRTLTCPGDLHFNPDVEWTEYPCHHPSRAQCNK